MPRDAKDREPKSDYEEAYGSELFDVSQWRVRLLTDPRDLEKYASGAEPDDNVYLGILKVPWPPDKPRFSATLLCVGFVPKYMTDEDTKRILQDVLDSTAEAEIEDRLEREGLKR